MKDLPVAAIVGAAMYTFRPHETMRDRLWERWDRRQRSRVYRGKRPWGTVVFKKERLVTGIMMEVVGEFVGRNDNGKNEGGFVVALKTSNGGTQEVAAVAIERTNALHPDTPYRDKVEEVVKDAEFTVDKINELLEKYRGEGGKRVLQ